MSWIRGMKDAKKGKVDSARACFLSQEDSIEGKERHVLKGEALMTLQDRVNPWTTGRQASNWPNPFWRDTTGAFTSLFDIAEGKHLNAKTHWSQRDLLIQHFTSALETPNQRPTTVSHKKRKRRWSERERRMRGRTLPVSWISGFQRLSEKPP